MARKKSEVIDDLADAFDADEFEMYDRDEDEAFDDEVAAMGYYDLGGEG